MDDPRIDSRDIPLSREEADPKLILANRLAETIQAGRVVAGHLIQRIVFVKGDDHYPDLVRRMLIYKGYDVDIVSSIEDIDDALKGCKPSAILIDLDAHPSQTPDDLAGYACPVIALSSLPRTDSKFTTRIPKPFDPSRFLAVIRDALAPGEDTIRPAAH